MDLLASEGYDPVYGARPVKRAIQHSLETMLAQAILRGDVADEDAVTVDVSQPQDGGAAKLVLSKTAASSNGAPAAAAPSKVQAAAAPQAQ